MASVRVGANSSQLLCCQSICNTLKTLHIGYYALHHPMGPSQATKGKTMPGLTSVASFVNHEHIGPDANDPTDITL